MLHNAKDNFLCKDVQHTFSTYKIQLVRKRGVGVRGEAMQSLGEL